MAKMETVDARDRERFDAFVGAALNGDFLQSWAWGDLKARMGWRAHRLWWRDGERVRASASLLEHPLPLGGRSLFYAPRGPVLPWAEEETCRQCFDALGEYVRQRRGILLKCDPDLAEVDAGPQGLRPLGLRPARRRGRFEGLQPRHVCRIRVDRPLTEIVDGFTSKCRYNIRLAERRKVEVRDGGREDIGRFHDLLQETARRDGFHVRPRDYLDAVWEATCQQGHGRLLLAAWGREVLAGIWIVHLGRKVWYLYGASSSRRRELMPNYALQWTAIRWAHEQGAEIYDFLGVPPREEPGNPINGLLRFKRGFGSQVTSFVGEYDLVLGPAAYALWQVVDPIMARSLIMGAWAREHLMRRERPRAGMGA